MRVLVCRPRADGEATAARLAAIGHEGVVAPVLVIETRAVALPAGPLDALIVTSRHALAGLSTDDAARLRHRPVYVVGAATARAARARGFTDVRIGQGDAAGLADLVALTLPPGADLLYLAGADHKDALPEALHRRGDRLVQHEAYAARPAEPWPAAVVEALRAGGIDACLHFSRRSAELARAAGQAAGVEAAFVALRHACLSDDAAAPLRPRCHTIVIAALKTEDSLLQALTGSLA